ncbi:MAG TPA: hypothetical protein VEX65_09310 [Flavisolibacter sp.]|jgi:hypothetical protein|nr:hypothetical protein [Flavisolibacter sp.]
MNRFILSTEGTILFRMSNNAEHYNEGKGEFEVRHQNIQSRFFETLFEAFLFYYTIDEEAELWDKTNGPVMIEKKIMLHLN